MNCWFIKLSITFPIINKILYHIVLFLFKSIQLLFTYGISAVLNWFLNKMCKDMTSTHVSISFELIKRKQSFYNDHLKRLLCTDFRFKSYTKKHIADIDMKEG